MAYACPHGKASWFAPNDIKSHNHSSSQSSIEEWTIPAYRSPVDTNAIIRRSTWL